jgi:hypothetical protein
MLGCAMVFAGSIGFAGAYFTAQTSVPDNVIRAGNISLAATPVSEAVSIENLAPGQSQSRVLTLTNTGSLPVNVTVTESKKAGITEFYNALACVGSSAGRPIYDGALAGMATAPVRIDPGQSVELEFAVSIPAEGGNTLAGDYVRLTLYVDATQVL